MADPSVANLSNRPQILIRSLLFTIKGVHDEIVDDGFLPLVHG